MGRISHFRTRQNLQQILQSLTVLFTVLVYPCQGFCQPLSAFFINPGGQGPTFRFLVGFTRNAAVPKRMDSRFRGNDGWFHRFVRSRLNPVSGLGGSFHVNPRRIGVVLILNRREISELEPNVINLRSS